MGSGYRLLVLWDNKCMRSCNVVMVNNALIRFFTLMCHSACFHLQKVGND